MFENVVLPKVRESETLNCSLLVDAKWHQAYNNTQDTAWLPIYDTFGYLSGH